jgi:hypothetical protein
MRRTIDAFPYYLRSWHDVSETSCIFFMILVLWLDPGLLRRHRRPTARAHAWKMTTSSDDIASSCSSVIAVFVT